MSEINSDNPNLGETNTHKWTGNIWNLLTFPVVGYVFGVFVCESGKVDINLYGLKAFAATALLTIGLVLPFNKPFLNSIDSK
jgi:hypothetical protein